ncbi:MAG: hypothetical protein ACI9EF_003212 [Pseudohongiellaceae bacterium]|jgi:hypothetical protein
MTGWQRWVAWCRRSGTAFVLPWVLLAVAACGGDAPPVSTPLTLHPQGSTADEAVTVVWSGAPAETLAPWTVEVGQWTVLQTTTGQQGLRLSGGGAGDAVVLSCQGNWDLATFDQLRLKGTGNDKTRVQLAFRKNGRRLGGSAPVPMAHGASAGETLVELPASLAGLGHGDTLVLIFDGRPEGLVIESLELLRRPAAKLVPDPQQPAPLVFLNSVARRGVGLLVGRPLQASVSVPEGAVLRFAVGRPPAAEPSSVLWVRCRDQDGDVVLEQRLGPPRQPLTEIDQEQGWTAVVLDLASLAGQRLTVSFELFASESVPAGQRRALAALVAGAVIETKKTPTGGAVGIPRQWVLLVTSDTHRGDHLGLARNGVTVSTPHLDALAQRGVLFEECFASTNFTNPSHVALMTGVHPRDTGILDNGHGLDHTAQTLAEIFGAQGWDTWAVTSAAHLRPGVSGLGQGFQRFARTPKVQRRAGDAVAQALSWLDEGGSAPVFLWLHVFDAHMPYESPEPFDRLGYEGPEDPFDGDLPDPGLSQELPGNMAGLRVLDFGRSQYAAQVTYLDHELGRLLDHPQLAQSIVAVVGDHGEVLGAHDIWFDHAELYSDTLHVPLVLSWPEAPAGSRRSERVSHLDVGRTLLDLAGLDAKGFPGHSLSTPSRAQPLFALASHGTSASITLGDEHLIMHLLAHNRRYAAHQLELFDLARDPGCERDLVHEEISRAAPLAAQLVDWLGARRDLGWRGEAVTDDDTLQGLAELGYVDAPQGAPAPNGLPYFIADDCSWCLRWR